MYACIFHCKFLKNEIFQTGMWVNYIINFCENEKILFVEVFPVGLKGVPRWYTFFDILVLFVSTWKFHHSSSIVINKHNLMSNCSMIQDFNIWWQVLSKQWMERCNITIQTWCCFENALKDLLMVSYSLISCETSVKNT